MRKLVVILPFACAFVIANSAQGLPAPSTLNERERRAIAPRPTPTPVVKARPVVAPEGQRPSTTVIIDAGHGGFDRGGIPRQRVPEKTMNLDVALRLKSVLQAYGYRVVMTRDNDVFVPLGTRVAIANSYRDAIFVCIHFNAAPRGSASGIETYFYSSESLQLASAIHYYVAGGAPSANRGVRRRGFFVLRKTTIPSVLVECGFLTNPTEAQYAQSAAYRQKLAEEIGRGVRERALVAGSSSGNRLAANSATVPLQPFIDQTHYRDPDLTRHRKKSSKSSSKSTSSKRKKSSDSASDSETKSKKKKSKSADTEG
jgi:N-acetylmuramoyl-L-alanine amidase